MKTTKLYLSIALVALTAISYGRISEPIAGEDCCTSEVVYEQAQDLEDWMSVPFKSMIENSMDMEIWMSVPFEAGVIDEVLSIESWMTTSFEVTEDIEVENWMTAAWI